MSGIVINIVARASGGLGWLLTRTAVYLVFCKAVKRNCVVKTTFNIFSYVSLIHACCYVSGMLLILGRGNDTIVALVMTVH